MKILLFGATGMVGQGVLREALADPRVERVHAVGRTPLARDVPRDVPRDAAKLAETVHGDLFDLTPVQDDLAGYDACLFCLGVSASGASEAAYTRLTLDLTLSVARTLLERNPGLRFVYVSGEGTDASERGRAMWARVKGRTENELLRLPFGAAYMFRPGFIKAAHGEVSKTPLYRAIYAVANPLFPLLRALAPAHVTTTENVALAMLRAVREGAPKRVLDNRDIEALAAEEKRARPAL